MPLKFLTQIHHISSKIQYKPPEVQIIEVYSFNEQAFTFQLHNYSGFTILR